MNQNHSKFLFILREISSPILKIPLEMQKMQNIPDNFDK